MRTSAYRRWLTYRHINSRKRFCRQYYGRDYYPHVHQYSKGKIHCSCPMCADKTRSRARYGKRTIWKHSDEQKNLSMIQQQNYFKENSEEDMFNLCNNRQYDINNMEIAV